MGEAFARSLEEVRAGRQVIRLLVDHDPDLVLCDTSDGTLQLWADGKSLDFGIDGRTRRGRRVLAMLACWPDFRECSIGGSLYPSRTLDIGADRYLSRVKLREVSIVRSGGFPGTRLTIL
jgi:phage head maturation protease